MYNTVQLLLMLLVTGMILVNGWTDAPNAIATAVQTKAVPYQKAVWMAAVCNLAGVLLMSLFNCSVADTITGLINYGDVSSGLATVSLCAGIAAVIVFAVAAWRFGIPTSESHALIAGLSGAGVALTGWRGLGVFSLIKVGIGLLCSLLAGFAMGWLVTSLLSRQAAKVSPRLLDKFQVASAAANAFMHGAQDGQKFIGVFVAADFLAQGQFHYGRIQIQDHLLAAVFCACVMALGTSIGGRRIIEGIGRLTPLEKFQGVSADIASVLCLLFGSWFGLPMSTTHTKTMAVIGSGAAENKRGMNLSAVGGMLAAWGATFPVCGLLGCGFAKLLRLLF